MTSENPANPPAPPTIKAHEDAPDKTDHPQSTQLPTSRPKVQIPPSHSGYKVTCEKKRDGWDRAKMGAEFIGFIFLVIYTLYTAGIYHANRKAAKAAKSAADIASQTMKIAYRPRVIIASLGPNATTRPGKPGFDFLEDGRIRMVSNISNIGPLTARNVRYFTFWEIIGKRENAKRLPYSETNEPFGHLKTIFPKISGYDSSSAFFTDRLTPEQIKAITLSGIWSEFSVLITYDDDFGEPHGTEYCDMFIIGGAQDICPWNIRND